MSPRYEGKPNEERDLGVWLPYLSTYMGHATYTATAYYVHLLPQRKPHRPAAR
jgi:hypothetical protein